ncbi:MAG: hypothetical protein ABIQ01_11375 [Pseudolysinimonas sp.]
MRVLVVGATGILRPAVEALAARGDDVTGVSRGVAGIPDGVRALAVDARDREALAATLGGRSWDRAIVYRNVVRAESLPEIELRVEGRLVLVRTSDPADPARGEPTERSGVLQLGWTDDGSGGTRWHTREEISAAALAVLEDGEYRMLGVVRPWRDRPVV